MSLTREFILLVKSINYNRSRSRPQLYNIIANRWRSLPQIEEPHESSLACLRSTNTAFLFEGNGYFVNYIAQFLTLGLGCDSAWRVTELDSRVKTST